MHHIFLYNLSSTSLCCIFSSFPFPFDFYVAFSAMMMTKKALLSLLQLQSQLHKPWFISPWFPYLCEGPCVRSCDKPSPGHPVQAGQQEKKYISVVYEILFDLLVGPLCPDYQFLYVYNAFSSLILASLLSFCYFC